MKIELWPVERLIPYARNALKITQIAVDAVALSIERFGFVQPIVVDKEGVICIGHVRRLAAMKLKLTEVPVHVADYLSPSQIRQLRLMDNRSHENVDWDRDLLGSELLELQALGLDLTVTGFGFDELNTLMSELPKGLTDEDAVPNIHEVCVTASGDLWVMGNHRLLCGDATEVSDVERLMCGETADLVFTDPPYNVDYEGYTEDRLKIDGDRMTPEKFREFLRAAFVNYRNLTKPGGSMYVCHSSLWQRDFQDAIELAGFDVRCQIIWAKNTFAWGFGRYKFQHEPIFYAHVTGQRDPWYGDKSQSTLWTEKKPAANRVHPTSKPVELVDRALINSSKSGDIVADLFGGSGSTLIACERRIRMARMMEIDPRYADCIVRRWQEFSGKEAVLADGRRFEAVAAERTAVEV
jgi:DNA modification methylase